MPPSLICTRICPPPATEGPPPGGGRAANDGVAVGRKGTKISRFTARRCRDLLLIFGRVDDVGAFKAACP